MAKISKQLREEIILSRKLASWIGDQIENANVSDTRKARSAMALYHIAFTHHGAVLTLIDLGFRVSALALLRPLFESYLRGAWIEVSANDDELDSFLSGELSPNFKALLSAAKQVSGDDSLPKFVEMMWVRVCHFTHSGAGLLNRYQDKGSIGDTTPEKDCEASILFCDVVVSFAFIQVSKLMGKPEYEQEILKKFSERKPRYETYFASALASAK
jgi:hypothetical protein